MILCCDWIVYNVLGDAGYKVVAWAKDGVQAIQAARPLKPHAAILDIQDARNMNSRRSICTTAAAILKSNESLRRDIGSRAANAGTKEDIT